MRFAVITLCASMAVSSFAADYRSERQSSQSGSQQRPNQAAQNQSVNRLNKASSFIGAPVRSLSNERVGEIKDVVVDFRSGTVAYVVVDAQEMLNEEQSFVAVPARFLQPNATQRGFTLRAERSQIERLRTFAQNKYPAFRSRAERQASVYDAPQSSRSSQQASTSARNDRSANTTDYLILQEDPDWVYYEWHVLTPDAEAQQSGQGAGTQSESGYSDNSSESQVERYSSQYEQNQRSSSSEGSNERQRSSSNPRAQTFLGYVTDVDMDNRTLTVDGQNGERTFEVAQDAAFFNGSQQKARLGQIRKGQRVRLQYRNENGENTASQVVVTGNPQSQQ